MRLQLVVAPVTLLLNLAPMAGAVEAQPLGTFRWQQEPYCNVFTLTVEQKGGVYTLDGDDDQCGATAKAAVVGIAVLNPDGSIGLGLTVISTPGGMPLHVNARVSASTVSGTWRDSSGQSGAWAFTPHAGSGGSPRPIPRTVFPSGLSAGGAAISNVGPPTAPTDAATKAFVDSGDATARAYSRSLVTLAVPVNAYAAALIFGDARVAAAGCRYFDRATGGALALDLAVPVTATIATLVVRYRIDAGATVRMTFDLRAVDTPEFDFFSDTSVLSFTSSLGVGPTGGYRNDSRAVSAPPVTSTRSYYLVISAPPSVGGALQFCGAEVRFSMP